MLILSPEDKARKTGKSRHFPLCGSGVARSQKSQANRPPPPQKKIQVPSPAAIAARRREKYRDSSVVSWVDLRYILAQLRVGERKKRACRREMRAEGGTEMRAKERGEHKEQGKDTRTKLIDQ